MSADQRWIAELEEKNAKLKAEVDDAESKLVDFILDHENQIIKLEESNIALKDEIDHHERECHPMITLYEHKIRLAILTLKYVQQVAIRLGEVQLFDQAALTLADLERDHEPRT